MFPLCPRHHHPHLIVPWWKKKRSKRLLRSFVSMERERKREGRQTEIPRLSRLVYYGRKSLRLSHCSINHLARKRALIIARYQICIRLHSARFFALTLLPFPYPFDINQFGRLLCVLRFIFLFFFLFVASGYLVVSLPFEKYSSSPLLKIVEILYPT